MFPTRGIINYLLVNMHCMCVCLSVCAVDGDVEMDDGEQDYSFTEYFQ